MLRLRSSAALLALLPFAAFAQTTPAAKPARTTPDPDPIARIKDEGMNRSQVMTILSALTDNFGPRVTGSPALRQANEWTRDELTRYGLVNAKLEAWGPFGRGWTLTSYHGEVLTPSVQPLQAYPKAWAPGCNLQNAEVVWVDATTGPELEKYRGKLRGKVVLAGPMREVKPHFDPEASRQTDKELLDLADAPDPAADKPGYARPSTAREREVKKRYATAATRARFFVDEGVALILDPSRAGDGGNIFVQQASGAVAVDTTSMETLYASSGKKVWDKEPPTVLPQAAVSIEQYNHLCRMIRNGQPVRVNVRTAVEFHDKDLMQYNTVAEIPGTDKAAEVVMLGGHLDSWQGGTGATDNAAGVAVAMEAVRILKELDLKPRRTIRVALWTGEEQGIFGSEAYVKQHFGEREKDDKPADRSAPPRVVTKPEWEKLSAYFNLDNGAGKIRGVYLQGNDAVRPIFRQWLAPLKDLGATTLTLSNTGGTDHLSFDAVGLPGFQFIQDELEYSTRTHHSTQDVFDRAPADDMKQAATVMAAFVYQTAMRDEMLPRKPVTKATGTAKKAKEKKVKS